MATVVPEYLGRGHHVVGIAVDAEDVVLESVQTAEEGLRVVDELAVDRQTVVAAAFEVGLGLAFGLEDDLV